MSAFAAKSVKASEDLTRILGLPRLEVTKDWAESLVDEWTSLLATKAGKAAGVRLLPWQAMALYLAYTYRGLYAALPVGQGKTLISYLLAVVMDLKRPLLIIPAALEEQTRDSFAIFSRHWINPSPPPQILTNETLAQPANADILRGVLNPKTGRREHGRAPDGIVIDEADTLRNPKSAAVLRIDRWKIEAPDTFFGILGGTPGRLSILDHRHHLIWCFGEGAPVPELNSEAETWANAIDEAPSRFGKRPGVGELRRLFLPGDNGTLVDMARRGYFDRVKSTPGVLIVDEDSAEGIPLEISQTMAPDDPVLEKHFEPFRKKGILPNGRALAGPLEKTRFELEMGTGVFKRWVPDPRDTPVGIRWLGARNTWWRTADRWCEDSQNWDDPLDTEGAVSDLIRSIIASGQVLEPDSDEAAAVLAWQDWQAVKDTFIPNSETEWLSGSVVYAAAAWAAQAPGLIWCWNPDFAEAVQTVSGLKLYAKKGKTKDGEFIGKAKGDVSAIMTVASNLRGRNLQAFNRNLLINPPPGGRYLEQLYGRTHRRGQLRAVTAEVMITSGGVADAFESAIREGGFGKSVFGITQKLLRADVRRCTIPTEGYRWARRVRRGPAPTEED